MKRFILTLALLFGLVGANLAFASSPASAASANGGFKDAACSGLNQVDSDTKADCSNLDNQGNGVSGIIHTVVNILSIIVGVAAVIMIIVSGFRFITSGGDSSKVAGARSALIYALIGIVVVALAQLLVNFVFTESQRAGNEGCSPGYHRRASDNNCVPD